MAFTLNGTIIEQTGTDTDLSGLVGVAGVTTFVTQHKTFYTLDATIVKMTITGGLSYDPDFECLIFQDVTDDGALVIDAGGTLTMGIQSNVNGVTRFSTGDALFIPDDDGGLPDERALVVRGGGTFIMNGGSIYHGNANGVRTNGTVVINKGRFVLTSLDTESIQYFRIEAGGSMDVFDVEIDSARPTTAVQILFAQNGISQFSGSLQCCALQNRTGAHTGPLSLRNIILEENSSSYDFLITGNAAADNRSQATEIRNVDIGTDFAFQYSSSDNTFHLAIFQEMSFKVLDSFQNPIENAKVRIETTDSGNRINPGTSPQFINFIDYTTGFDTYEQLTNTQGDTPVFEVLTGRLWDSGLGGIVEDLYSIGQVKGDDNFLLKFASYNHNLANSVGILKSSKPLSFEQILSIDNLITEQDKAISAAYTTQEDAFKVYDQLKSILIDNYLGEVETFVTRESDFLDARALDVTIDGTGTGIPTIVGNTLTLYQFTGRIKTTGTVSLINGALPTFVEDSNGTQNSVTLTFQNLTDSVIEIFDQANTNFSRVSGQNGAYVFNTPLGSVGVWDYVIDRPGYTPLKGSFDATGSDQVIEGSLNLLRRAAGAQMYTASSSPLVSFDFDFITPQLSIRIANGEVEPQVIFDMIEDVFIAPEGVRWTNEQGSLVRYDSLPGAGPLLFLEDNIRLQRLNPTDVNAAVGGYVQSTQGVPIDGINGSVQYIGGIQSAGYQGGSIWLDTVDGAPGTSSYVNGVADNPSIALADVRTLRNNLKIKKIKVVSNSNITLDDAMIGYEFNGEGYSLDINGQDISDSRFQGAIMYGTGITGGGQVIFDRGVAGFNRNIPAVETLKVPPSRFFGTAIYFFEGSGPGTYGFIDCFSAIAGGGAPTVDLELGVSGHNVYLRRWSGGLTFQNVETGDTVSLDTVSGGTITVNGTGGTVNIRGILEGVVDNSGGAVTIVQTAVIPTVSAGGSADWSVAEREQIRDALGVDGTKTAATGGQLQSKSEFDPVNDVVARVTLVDTTTANTDMRGTDGANTQIPLTASQVNAEVDQALVDYDGPTKAELDAAQASIEADIAAIPATDLSSLETKAQADTRQTSLITEINANETKIDSLATDVAAIPTTDSVADLTPVLTAIGNLNDITASDVLAQLNLYDAPTKAELDAAQASIETAIASGSITVAQVWGYLQSETTISGSMKEALELALKNSKLIPAAL